MKIMVANGYRIQSVLGVRTGLGIGLESVTGSFSVTVRVRNRVRDIRVQIGFRTDLVRIWVRTFWLCSQCCGKGLC